MKRFSVCPVSDNGVLKRYLVSLLTEWGFVFSGDASHASLLLIDLDTAKEAETALPAVTVSADPFAGSDLLRPFSARALHALILERLGVPDDAPLPTVFCESENKREDGENDPPALLLAEGGFCYGGAFVALSPAEFRLFSLLYSHRGEVVPTEACAEALAEKEAPSKGNAPSVYIHHLREKLDYRFNIRMILTLRGKGYVLTE